jgi:hypothetical protein
MRWEDQGCVLTRKVTLGIHLRCESELVRIDRLPLNREHAFVLRYGALDEVLVENSFLILASW